MTQAKFILNESSDTLSAGKTMMIEINPFDVIDDIILEFNKDGEPATVADIKKAIGNISLKFNGGDVINAPLTAIYDIYKKLGSQVNQPLGLTNVIGLNVARLLFKSPENEDYFAWGCRNVNTIQLHMYCAKSVTGVTDVTVKTIRRKFQADLGAVIKVINYSQTVKSTGLYVATNLPKNEVNEAYLSLNFYNGGGVISEGEFKVNSDTLIQPTSKKVMDYIISQRGYCPLDNSFDFTFYDGSIRQFLPMAGMNQILVKANFIELPTSNTCDLIAITIKGIPTLMWQAFAQNG